LLSEVIKFAKNFTLIISISRSKTKN